MVKKKKEFPRKNSLIWREFTIESGYSIHQTSIAIKELMKEHDNWVEFGTEVKIEKIYEYMEQNSIEKTCL
jgi:hypothetical protein